MIVYARKSPTNIWSDNNKAHKAGKVPLHEPLEVISESGGCYAIKRPATISLPPQPNYPNYWVATGDVLDEMPVTTEPSDGSESDGPGLVIGEVSDNDLAIAIVVILKWLKQ